YNPGNISEIAKNWNIYLKGGYTLIDAIRYSQSAHNSKKFNRITRLILNDLERGISPEIAIKRYKKILPDFFINLFITGVLSGNLEIILEDLSEFYRWEQEEKDQIKSKLYYPVIIITIFCFLLIFIVLYLLPEFTVLYDALELNINNLTYFLIETGSYMRANLLLIILSVLFLIISLYLLLAKIQMLEYFKLKIPIYTKIINWLSFNRFFMSLAIQIASGIEISQSIKIAAEVSGHQLIQKRINNICEDISRGENLTESLRRWLKFEDRIYNLLVAGERSGGIVESLEFSAEIYRYSLVQYINRINQLVEPVILVVLTVMIGGLAYLLLSPIWSIFGNGFLQI
ncbi:MAG: type II secretion system F family protein, partial [Halarsenatibacteraceae bacterium]